MRHRNLLFLYTDEQAFHTLATYGNKQIEMPNLNRLADQSVVFDQAYVTQPVCTPSRSTLLTGLYPHTTGCTENNVPLAPAIESEQAALRHSTFIEWNGPNNGLGDMKERIAFPEWMTRLAHPEAIKAACADPVRTVITPDGWKFNRSPRGEGELYNLTEDPGETQNLHGRPEYRTSLTESTDQLRKRQERTGDAVSLPEW